jgi:hypothetical protein
MGWVVLLAVVATVIYCAKRIDRTVERESRGEIRTMSSGGHPGVRQFHQAARRREDFVIVPIANSLVSGKRGTSRRASRLIQEASSLGYEYVGTTTSVLGVAAVGVVSSTMHMQFRRVG